MEEAVLGITQPGGHGLLGAPSPAPLSAPSPRVRRSVSPPCPAPVFLAPAFENPLAGQPVAACCQPGPPAAAFSLPG